MSAVIDLPEAGPLLSEHREALAGGRLTFQRCAACANAWLPPRDACPRCLSPEWAWEDAAGTGRVVSWVVYHRAYHPAFEGRVPYNVTLVELDEGPRVMTNVIDVEGGDGLAIDLPLAAVFEREGDVPVARFRRV
jgi:uncharacterized protein